MVPRIWTWNFRQENVDRITLTIFSFCKNKAMECVIVTTILQWISSRVTILGTAIEPIPPAP